MSDRHGPTARRQPERRPADLPLVARSPLSRGRDLPCATAGVLKIAGMKLAPRTPFARDLLLAVAVTAVAQIELVLLAAQAGGPVVWHHATSLLILPALALRRRAPLWSILIAAVGLLFQPLIGPAAVATPYLALLFLLASLGWFAPLRQGVVGVAVTLVCGLGYDTLAGAAPVADVVVNAALLVLAWAAGRGLRVTTDRRVAAEVEADRTARAAVDAERGRIARDVHDSLGHALTLMTLQAGSARERVDQPVASEALTLIERTGREALTDLHRVLGLLDLEGDRGKGLAHLPDLVAGIAPVGLQVDLEVQAHEVPRSVANATYWVVQEALTNIARHSHARVADVRVCSRAGELVTVVADPGPARHGARPGTGRGLMGLQRRLEPLGGTLAVASDAAGWRVEVHIPLPERSP
ncbi:sensor histidine kinase [Egicoccus sp. AB-alg2]|uniref:sensor histidine kinase n=1 Tax=Egicoccus sp. AB-alg2 TaxID=3242693 RepID=UPI00359CEDC6